MGVVSIVRTMSNSLSINIDPDIDNDLMLTNLDLLWLGFKTDGISQMNVYFKLEFK